MNWRYLLLPFVAPIAFLWMVCGIFLILAPAEIIAFSLLAIGEGAKAERIFDWACETLFYERAPWKWLAREP